MEISGRRRFASGSSNNNTGVQSNVPVMGRWLCVSDAEVQFFQDPSLGTPTTQWCQRGTLISATKEGDWLKESESGLYLPCSDAEGNRHFRSEKLLLMEEASKLELPFPTPDALRRLSRQRTKSSSSLVGSKELAVVSPDAQRTASRLGSKSSTRQGSKELPFVSPDAQRTASRSGSKSSTRQGSKEHAFLSPGSQRTASIRSKSSSRQASKDSLGSGSPSKSTRKISFSMPSRSGSFMWVDAHGVSRSLSSNSELLKSIGVRPEVWVCLVPAEYHTAPSFTSPAFKECGCGSRVNAIRQDDWLKVVEVESSYDAASVAQAFGHRSLRPSKVTLKDTGFFLPLMQDGEVLFKNEKLFDSEAIQSLQDPRDKCDKGNGCSLM